MIKQQDDMVKEIKTRMRGGDGQVELTHLFKPGEFDGKCRLMARITLEKGCSIGLHEHQHEEEIFYILDGEAMLSEYEGDFGKPLRPGDASIVKAGGCHAIRNDRDQPLNMLALILLTE